MRLLHALLLAASTWPAHGQAPCRVVDGDSLQCGQERVRLRRVYAAEIGEPGGPEAKARLQQALDGAGEVRIERVARDGRGRALADVYVDGRKIVQSDIGPRAGRGAGRRTKSSQAGHPVAVR